MIEVMNTTKRDTRLTGPVSLSYIVSFANLLKKTEHSCIKNINTSVLSRPVYLIVIWAEKYWLCKELTIKNGNEVNRK